jgi:2'-5' RNA ligase
MIDSGLRVFIAAYPPSPVVDMLAARAADLDLPAHRVTPLDQVHLTLQFVGEVDRRELERVIESAERAAAGVGSFEVVPNRLICLPERGPARLIAAAAPEVSPLTELTRRLAARLARKPGKGRRFLPHLTLLRFRASARDFSMDEAIEPTPFTVDRIAVMRSTLTKGGAEHREVREILL